MNRFKQEAIISSVIIYLIIIALIFIITMYAPKSHKAKNYTKKNSHTIEVSLGSPLSKQTQGRQKASKTHNKPLKKRVEKKKVEHKRVKKVRNHKAEKKVTKKRVVKSARVKKSLHKSRQAKKADTGKLFKNLTSTLKDDSSSAQKAGKSGKSRKRVDKSRGVENRYFANIQNRLRGWPAQRNFVGEKISVELTVYSSGLFTYKILHRSINPEFNRALQSYLEQLKRIGFGPHSNPKPYHIIVDFIAKG